MNAVLRRRTDLSGDNYILRPSPTNRYWANISSGRLEEFRTRRGEAFNLVIVGAADSEGDFYAIPYPVVKQALTPDHRSIDKTGRLRWVAWIKNHQLRIGRYPTRIDVGEFYGCHAILTSPGKVDLGSAADLNDYAIENRKIEIEQRQKQSLFRKQVLLNFEGRCCLSDIRESDLLVASHIIPWAKRIETRLDPSNGILLYSPFDRLFDKGFISFDDALRVVVTPRADGCSPPLRAILAQLDGQQARHPVKWTIKSEYLAYHRAEVLRSTAPVTEALPTFSHDTRT